MRRIRDYDVSGKKVLLRVDLNCPVENNRIEPGDRVEAHAKTIRELSDRGAQVVVLAHQGRKGDDDFLTLEQHGAALGKLIGKNVKYVPDVLGDQAKSAIAGMSNGNIILLDNVRSIDDEKKEDGSIVAALSPLADYFVIDALSVAHRAQASVSGFAKTKPAFAGDVLAAEIDALQRVKNAKDSTFILGGSKVADSFSIMRNWLSTGRARKFLIGGALCILLLKASGKPIGESAEYLEEEGLIEHVDEAKQLLEQFRERIVLPVDVGLNDEGQRVECDVGMIGRGAIFDIGEKTIAAYKKEIGEAGVIVMNGPMGVYEMEQFAKGTKELLSAIMQSKAYSLIGGGHTLTAIAKFSMDKAHFGYVSLSGKALIEYLCGKELPAIVALEENEKKFNI